jgi:hypothetical protein
MYGKYNISIYLSFSDIYKAYASILYYNIDVTGPVIPNGSKYDTGTHITSPSSLRSLTPDTHRGRDNDKTWLIKHSEIPPKYIYSTSSKRYNKSSWCA